MKRASSIGVASCAGASQDRCEAMVGNQAALGRHDQTRRQLSTLRGLRDGGRLAFDDRCTGLHGGRPATPDRSRAHGGGPAPAGRPTRALGSHRRGGAMTSRRGSTGWQLEGVQQGLGQNPLAREKDVGGCIGRAGDQGARRAVGQQDVDGRVLPGDPPRRCVVERGDERRVRLGEQHELVACPARTSRSCVRRLPRQPATTRPIAEWHPRSADTPGRPCVAPAAGTPADPPKPQQRRRGRRREGQRRRGQPPQQRTRRARYRCSVRSRRRLR